MERESAVPARDGRWGILATVCAGLFIILLQSNVINLAVTHIQKDFGASLASVEWINNGYLLAFTVLLVLLGRLGDRIGRKLMFLAGLFVYVAGSIVAGLAPTLGLVVCGSLIQGVGGASMMPATLSLIQAAFPPKERGAALGIWGAVSGLAVAIGPTLGGFLTDVGLGAAVNSIVHLEQGWRAIYFLCSILGVAVFFVALRVVPESRDTGAHKGFDIGGTILSGLAQFLLVFAVINGATYGWLARKTDFTLFGIVLFPGKVSITPILIVLSLVFLGLFILREKRCRVEPLIDLGLFRDRNFTAGSIVAAILFFSMMGTFFLIPVFLQGVLGYSAIRTGVTLLPLALAVVVAAPVSGRLSDAIGAKWVIVVGMAILCVGGILTARFTTGTTAAALILPFLVEGIGIGLAIPPITNIALLNVPLSEAGAASGTLSMIRQLGSILGIAVLAGVFSTAIPSALSRNVTAIDPSIVPAPVKEKIVGGLAGGAAQPSSADMAKMLGFYSKARAEQMQTAVSAAMKQGLVDSINHTFLYAAAVAGLGAATALVLRGRKKENGARS